MAECAIASLIRERESEEDKMKASIEKKEPRWGGMKKAARIGVIPVDKWSVFTR